MKVILTNGSSRKQGCTDAALREVERALNEGGIETEMFFIGKEALPDCIACRKCRQTGRFTPAARHSSLSLQRQSCLQGGPGQRHLQKHWSYISVRGGQAAGTDRRDIFRKPDDKNNYKGNTQYIAELIVRETDADLFEIAAKDAYPGNYFSHDGDLFEIIPQENYSNAYLESNSEIRRNHADISPIL